MDAPQEYFSAIINENKNESSGKTVANSRQTSKKTEYERLLCTLILLTHLLNPVQKFDNIDKPVAL